MTGTYTHGHHESVLRSHRWRTAANSAAHLLPHLRQDLDLLDVGCGPGTITCDLAHLVPHGRVLGIDASADVIAAAARDGAAAGSTARFEVGDAYAAARHGTFDVVHAHQVLQHLTDPVAALRAWRDAVRPGGLVAARDADYAAMYWWPAAPLLDRWCGLYRAVARANGGEPDAGRRLRTWALDAGFAEADIQVSTSAWTFASAEDLEWWTTTWAERTTATAFGRRAVELGLTDQDELDAIGRAWRKWSEERGATFVVPHGELLARRTAP